MMKKHLLIAGLLASLGGAAFAQQVSAPAAPASAASAAETMPNYIPYGNLEKADPKDVQRAKELGATIARELLEAYETRKTPEMVEAAQKSRRRADSIADEALSAERDKVLEFLGIDPEAEHALYYFVSWSMPQEMLRSYAIEAMWSGGSLVFKGVPPDKTLGEFVLKDLRSLVYGKGAAANISLDPRLFDSYGIKSVPSIVLTTVRSSLQCQGINPVSVKVGDKEGTYDMCPELDPSKYVKISGAVTSNYALQAFSDAGFPAAQTYLRALARGWAGGNVPGKEQQGFKGKWEDVLTPSEAMAARQAAEAVMPKASTPIEAAPPASK